MFPLLSICLKNPNKYNIILLPVLRAYNILCTVLLCVRRSSATVPRHIPRSYKSPQWPRLSVTSLFLIPKLVPYISHTYYTFARVCRVIIANGRRNIYIILYTSRWWSLRWWSVRAIRVPIGCYNLLFCIFWVSWNYWFFYMMLSR